MDFRRSLAGLTVIAALAPLGFAAAPVERIHNEKVLVTEQTLSPGEVASRSGTHGGVAVYLDAGAIEVTQPPAKPQPQTVQRGLAVFLPPQPATVRNAGSAPLRIVWTEYLGQGVRETWGATGLAPNYKLLFENALGRVYDIRMAAGKSEPLHSHHTRIVITLSGAELEHILPDGRKETSSLKTGEIAWRPAATHIGHNLGQTDLWVIAIEPK